MNIKYAFYTLFLLLFAPVSLANGIEAHEFQKSNSISNQPCIACHQDQHDAWLKSDHAKAMAIADKENVLADFNDVTVEHFGQKATFFIENGRYKVTIGYDDKFDTYPIIYAFGHYPLQQYLVETETGRLQLLPFAWDSHSKEEGGQRWYHNYAQEEIRPEDRLHWRQPTQNWNGMCADCHSDGLTRKFDIANNRFATEYDNINVGCLSCHGDMTVHGESEAKNPSHSQATTTEQSLGYWLLSEGNDNATWQGEKRDNRFMDTCFSCHSLRAPLADGIVPKKAFLDQFTPQLLVPPLYYPDGQIKEEVYVYGSFLQSKMFAEGVNCLDCHDKHTMKVKALDNSLCLQCHSAQAFNGKEHHQHQQESAGAQCVNCHMPQTRYMGVDDRTDHSFSIPRPAVSLEFGTPNACTKCHQEQTDQWANEAVIKWYGEPKGVSSSQHLLMLLRSGQPISLAQHLEIISDKALDIISRATAVQMLMHTTTALTTKQLAPYLSHDEPLLRLSAAMVASLLSENDRLEFLSPLLKDRYKAVRVAAARNLVNLQLSSEYQQPFDEALTGLVLSNSVSSWRGEGLANQGALDIELNDIAGAEQSYTRAIKVDPYFVMGYVNLAEVYRLKQKPFLEASVLKKGLANNQKSGDLHYAYGLHQVRAKKLEQAVSHFEKAVSLMPDQPHFAYTYVLAIDGTGDTNGAINKLKSLIVNYSDNRQLVELGLHLARKAGNRNDYQWFLKI